MFEKKTIIPDYVQLLRDNIKKLSGLPDYEETDHFVKEVGGKTKHYFMCTLKIGVHSFGECEVYATRECAKQLAAKKAFEFFNPKIES